MKDGRALLRLFTFVVAALLSIEYPSFAGAPDIGKAVAVKNEVSLETVDTKLPLTTGLVVHQDEIIITGNAASAEVELLDRTKLAVGPDAKIVLDKFVYDASAAPGSISIQITKGAFRFITGIAPKSAYKINTPTASLGVRGTVFDVYVADNGETAVLLHEGGVDMCNTASACQRLDRIGGILHVGVAGAFSALTRWDGTIMRGIGVARAFPFVGQRLTIDPVRRLSPDALIRGTGGIGGAIPNPGRLIPLPGLPF
jgi:hypothetical protein